LYLPDIPNSIDIDRDIYIRHRDFLGNDFYKGVGSVFSTFAVDNPDTLSEMDMLRKYGPDVSEELLRKLIAAFNELRNLVEEGQILYPYSTRELVNIVRHLQSYPKDNVGTILQNVFDFDLFFEMVVFNSPRNHYSVFARSQSDGKFSIF